MKKVILLLFVFSSFMMTSQEGQSFLLNVSELTIKPGHDEQFNEGVKRYKSCYQENNGEETWNIWKRIQGAGNVYVLTSTMENWAEMDDESEEQADRQCRDIVREFIWPHIESSNYSIARSMPEISASPGENMQLVWVTFFDVENTSDFREVVDAVSSAFKDAEGEPRGYWYAYMGGAADAPNYMVSVPFENFAELDVERDGPWDVLTKKHGEARAGEMRNKLRNSVDDIWSYLYQLKEDLSMSE
ncbi:hypothetical protein [Salinimicrobium sp. HB62]|uniref:hypothetical protein n=1 Tax=Salinimicrobium sp. HB62 TaxID=3077781 RepID=UPI002D79C2E7|nr:hypothetical protein [Salinimicrobium sp. HB62]